jgi:hypothetical protein
MYATPYYSQPQTISYNSNAEENTNRSNTTTTTTNNVDQSNERVVRSPPNSKQLVDNPVDTSQTQQQQQDTNNDNHSNVGDSINGDSNAAGGTGNTITVNVHPSPGMDEQALAAVVSRQLAFEMRRGGF